VRAAAGITLVIGAVAFSYAYFDRQHVPLQVVTALRGWMRDDPRFEICAGGRCDVPGRG
jgi:hypothetical protein